jgi:hypothetical protein
MVKVLTQYDYPEVKPEYNSGESDVDIALYRPTAQRIEDMVHSGETLEDVRRLEYHTDYLNQLSLDDNFTDPLLYRGYDRVDLELLHKEAIEDIIERQNVRVGKAEASEKADGSSEADVDSLQQGVKPDAGEAKPVVKDVGDNPN